jgi:hypothetical protein
LLPVTATAFAGTAGESIDLVALTGCGIAPPPTADRDIWVFRLARTAPHALVSLSATFESSVRVEPTLSTPMPAAPSTGPAQPSPTVDVPARTVVIRAGVEGRDGAVIDDSAWVAGPAGWALTGATADVTVDTGALQLTAACPAEQITTKDPLVVVGLSTPPGKRQSPPTAAHSRYALPVTGADVASIATLGAGLVLTGALLILAHGRRPKLASDPEEGDIRRPVVVIRRL